MLFLLSVNINIFIIWYKLTLIVCDNINVISGCWQIIVIGHKFYIIYNLFLSRCLFKPNEFRLVVFTHFNWILYFSYLFNFYWSLDFNYIKSAFFIFYSFTLDWNNYVSNFILSSYFLYYLIRYLVLIVSFMCTVFISLERNLLLT